MHPEFPRISVITPSLNQGRYIRQNILSVLAQDYPDIEHIVVDGGSTDGTLAVLKEYPHLRWISEPDGGQADALNKGLALATGSIIGWLNADDWYEPNIFASVARMFERPGTQWIVGGITMHYEPAGPTVPQASPKISYGALLHDPDIVRQPPTFFRRALLEQAGAWNAAYHMVMDYDLWLRLARRCEPAHAEANWAWFRIHPEQKTTFRNFWRQYSEIASLLRREKAPLACRVALAAGRAQRAARHAAKWTLVRLRVMDRAYLFRPLRVR